LGVCRRRIIEAPQQRKLNVSELAAVQPCRALRRQTSRLAAVASHLAPSETPAAPSSEVAPSNSAAVAQPTSSSAPPCAPATDSTNAHHVSNGSGHSFSLGSLGRIPSRLIVGYSRRAAYAVDTNRTCRDSLLRTLPIVLVLSFYLCATTSSSVFAAWTCRQFAANSITGGASKASKVAFLRDDLSLQCYSIFGGNKRTTAKHWAVLRLATVFVVIWAAVLPICYIALLLPVGKALRHKRATRLVHATSFLHREYESQWFLWEPVFLIQRLVLVGYVQLIPDTYSFIRLSAALMVIIAYLIVLMMAKPYKADDVDLTAIASQSALTCIFFSALCLKLFQELDELELVSNINGLAERTLGFGSQWQVTCAMIIFNIAVLVFFLATLVVRLMTDSKVRCIRLKSGSPPELTMAPEYRFHLFLSHVWSSAQDQVAVIKRRLQLLLPGVRVFLDVDDMESTDLLGKYIAESQCVQLFFSRGYFSSGACLREVKLTCEFGTPFHAVHETDEHKGGAPLATLRNEAHAKGLNVNYLFDPDVILQWHRVSDFQLLTLRRISAFVLHACPSYYTLKEPPEIIVPGELSMQRLSFRAPTVLYVSLANRGAAAFGHELVAHVGTERLKLTHVAPTSDGAAASGQLATHMLLYLNAHTFADPAGADAASFPELAAHSGQLADEVRQAMARSLPIVLVHEMHDENYPVDFGFFFKTTPQDLIDSGVYSKIATAAHIGAHRDVSLSIVAMELGAIVHNKTSMAESKETLRNFRRGSGDHGRRGSGDHGLTECTEQSKETAKRHFRRGSGDHGRTAGRHREAEELNASLDAPSHTTVTFPATLTSLGLGLKTDGGRVLLSSVNAKSLAAGVPIGSCISHVGESSMAGKSKAEVLDAITVARATGEACTLTFEVVAPAAPRINKQRSQRIRWKEGAAAATSQSTDLDGED